MVHSKAVRDLEDIYKVFVMEDPKEVKRQRSLRNARRKFEEYKKNKKKLEVEPEKQVLHEDVETESEFECSYLEDIQNTNDAEVEEPRVPIDEPPVPRQVDIHTPQVQREEIIRQPRIVEENTDDQVGQDAPRGEENVQLPR